jgi:hypothetical protein
VRARHGVCGIVMMKDVTCRFDKTLKAGVIGDGKGVYASLGAYIELAKVTYYSPPDTKAKDRVLNS